MSDLELRCRTSGPDDTRALAAAVAQVMQAGDVIALSGELGAGKTCFVQGAARDLGVQDRVVSPTFMLVRTYDADVPVVHVDVYRLNHMAELRDLGEEVFADEAVTFLEWGDAVEPVLPADRLEVEIVLGETSEDREVRLRGHGTWALRGTALAEGVRDWTDRQDA